MNVLPYIPPSGLSSIEDILTQEDREKLREDLRIMAERMHPCWDWSHDCIPMHDEPVGDSGTIVPDPNYYIGDAA